ncbi:MAG: flagellin, partial [Limnochordia bacterium]
MSHPWDSKRQLGVNQANSSKSMERLSSGMRINRAGDDAAGLAISEKMRGQIRGLKQAQRNAQDGISLIQTAEGALNETHAILQRMRELATQASTDTNTLTDRKEIQKEINQLLDEIDRIADKTTFNTQKLLDGSYDKKIFHIGANEGDNMEISITSMKTVDLGGTGSTGGTGGTTATSFENETVGVGGASFTLNGTYTGTVNGSILFQAVSDGSNGFK